MNVIYFDGQIINDITSKVIVCVGLFLFKVSRQMCRTVSAGLNSWGVQVKYYMIGFQDVLFSCFERFLLPVKSLLSFQSIDVILAYCVFLYCSIRLPHGKTSLLIISVPQKCIHLLYICRSCTLTVVYFITFDIAPWKMKIF